MMIGIVLPILCVCDTRFVSISHKRFNIGKNGLDSLFIVKWPNEKKDQTQIAREQIIDRILVNICFIHNAHLSFHDVSSVHGAIFFFVLVDTILNSFLSLQMKINVFIYVSTQPTPNFLTFFLSKFLQTSINCHRTLGMTHKTNIAYRPK